MQSLGQNCDFEAHTTLHWWCLSDILLVYTIELRAITQFSFVKNYIHWWLISFPEVLYHTFLSKLGKTWQNCTCLHGGCFFPPFHPQLHTGVMHFWGQNFKLTNIWFNFREPQIINWCLVCLAPPDTHTVTPNLLTHPNQMQQNCNWPGHQLGWFFHHTTRWLVQCYDPAFLRGVTS